MKQRVDHNQPAIIKFLQQVGAIVIDMSQTKCGFDILVLFRGKLFALEIKNPEQVTLSNSRESWLTTNEKRVKQLFDIQKVPYHIVLNQDEAMKAIGL